MKAKYISLRPFISWKEMKRPFDRDAVFGRFAPIYMEIGFGLGDFLVDQALKHPDRDFIGIELSWPTVRRALRKIALARARNVRVIRAPAKVALERIFPEKSLAGVYAIFPCPWPKKKHVQHRLFSSAFLSLLNSRLMDGGETLVVTDHLPYHEWIIEQVSGTGFEARPAIVPPKFSTKYERKWQGLGQDRFYELRLIKRKHIRISFKEDAQLIAHRIPEFAPERFRFRGSRGEIVVEGKEFLYDPERQKAMMRCLAGEDGWFQEFWIEIVRLEGAWHIRPAKGCNIVPTVSLQCALDLVRDAALAGV